MEKSTSIRSDLEYPCYCCQCNRGADTDLPCSICAHNINRDVFDNRASDYFTPIPTLI
jgi:hypothetical protein